MKLQAAHLVPITSESMHDHLISGGLVKVHYQVAGVGELFRFYIYNRIYIAFLKALSNQNTHKWDLSGVRAILPLNTSSIGSSALLYFSKSSLQIAFLSFYGTWHSLEKRSTVLQWFMWFLCFFWSFKWAKIP